MVGPPSPILHDDWVDEIPACQASPGTNVIAFPTLYDIERVEWINGVHEAVATVTGYRIHAVAFSCIAG